jgi:hypothetical protein
MSARMLPAVWILAVFAVLLCSPGATAQPPDLLGNPKGDCTPEARPADMRPFMRCCLIGLNPAAGLVCVDCLVEVEDEEPAPAIRLREICDRIIRLFTIRDEELNECRWSLFDQSRFICGLTSKNQCDAFSFRPMEPSYLTSQIIARTGCGDGKPAQTLPLPDGAAERYGCEYVALFAWLDRFYAYLYSDDYEVIAPDYSRTWLTGVPLFGEITYPEGAIPVDCGNFRVRKKNKSAASKSEATPPRIEYTCPYLNLLKESPPSTSRREFAPSCDFQENLNKLSVARKLYEMAQTYLRDGDRDGALYFFAQIHELVPGSRFDSQATERINIMARQGLAPTVPPIDPKIIDALQKLLKESGNPTAPRLIIHVEEQSVGEEEEPAVPSEWSDEPSAVEVPRLLVDPADDQLTLTPEEDEPAEPEEFSKEAWSALLRDAIEAIRSGLGVEVEMTAATPNVSQREHFGGIEIEVTIGSGGEQFVKVSLSPETSGDLRAAQQAHNERILNWIERLNEPCADEDDSAAEEEDATYGDEPRNEAIP